MKPTAEQIAALDQFVTGKNLKIVAFAGTGKTTTLRLLAGSRVTWCFPWRGRSWTTTRMFETNRAGTRSLGCVDEAMSSEAPD